WRERTVAPVQEDRNRPAEIRDGKVQVVVAIKVCDADKNRKAPNWGCCYMGSKRPVPKVEEHRYGVRVPIGDGEVNVAISVEVRGGDRVGAHPDVVVCARGEDPVALVQEDRNRIGTVIGDREIDRTVPVEVGWSNR